MSCSIVTTTRPRITGALLISGGIPVYLETDRNCYGLIGPIYSEALDEAAIREKIRLNPHVTDPEAWQKPRPFRVAVIEQCTYDGTIYSAEMILARIGHLCDYVLFDEAWASFMKFHPLYAGRFAMGLNELGESSPGIIATQSTHKQLASFSQASQIHIRDRHIKGQRRRVEHRPLQRELPAARLNVALLSDLRIARCRRTNDEGPLRDDPLGRHGPARHRNPQKAARDPP